jgi:hypothetical protein
LGFGFCGAGAGEDSLEIASLIHLNVSMMSSQPSEEDEDEEE